MVLPNYVKIVFMLKDKKLLPEGKKIDNYYNKIRFSAKLSEGTKHYIVKCMLGKIIRAKGDIFLSEWPTPSGRRFDILQIKNNEECIAYEVESNKYDKSEVKGVPIIELKLKNIPNDIADMENYIKKHIV